jgi:predicted secreted protein
MSGITLFAYYVLFWWMTLFAILSIGLRTQDEDGEIVPGTEPSAPANLRIWRQLLLNTVISGVLFAIWYYCTEVLGYGLSSFPSIFPQDYK